MTRWMKPAPPPIEEELPLFQAAARVVRQTQVDAYMEHVESGAAATQRARVCAYLRGCGPDGSTDAEGSQATGIPIRQFMTRRNELLKRKLVVDSGSLRPGPTGKANIVWRMA